MSEAAIAEGTGGGLRRFRYRAIDRATGRRRRGEMSGADAYAVRVALRRGGLVVEYCEPISDRAGLDEGSLVGRFWCRRQRSRRRAQRSDLFDALATLLRAGLPLEKAVQSLATSPARSAAERRMLQRVRERLRDGEPLHHIVGDAPDWFDAVDGALLAAGARTGDLADVLQGLSGYHQRGADLGHRLAMALAYPLLLTAAGIGVALFIANSTLPQLVGVLVDADKPVPWLSQWVLVTGQFLFSNGLWLVLAGIVVAVLGSMWWRRLPARSRLRRWLAANPIGRAQARGRIAQLSITLGRLQRHGLPLTEALDVVARSAGSAPLTAFLDDAAAAVRRGDDFSTQATASHLVDPEFAQLLRLGEQSGELAQMLERIGERYSRSAERSVARLTALLEPVAILVLAFFIGTVVLAAALPLVALGDLI